MKLLEFKDVSYIKEDRSILENLTLGIEQGELISVVGPSGSGKSTFFKLCCHLANPSAGDILYKGRNMQEYDPIELRRSIAYCFQSPYLFGETVEDNMAFPFSSRNLKTDYDKVEELLSKLNLDKGFIKKEVKNLSGGEKQRIALIRTLVFKPEVLLLDEATSALDADNALVVEKEIEELNRQGVTILWITHNPEQSRRYAKRLISIESGRIKAIENIRGIKPRV